MATFSGATVDGSIIVNFNGSDIELKGKLIRKSSTPSSSPPPASSSPPTKNLLPELAVGFSKPISSAFSLGTVSTLANDLGSLLGMLGIDATAEISIANLTDSINNLPFVSSVANALENASVVITDLVIDTRGGERNFLFGFGLVFAANTATIGPIALKALGVRVSTGFTAQSLADLLSSGIIPTN